jgi:Cytochrome c554 and c-prime
MRIISIVATTLIWIASLTTASTRVDSAAEQNAPQPAAQFAWAGACKECHSDIYNSWAKSKHANAIDRLSSSEKQADCARCHTTGPDPKNPRAQNVQCEACHGAAAEHAANPFSGVNPVKKPESDVCERCHNDKSPRFRGFVYSGMAKLVHVTLTK